MIKWNWLKTLRGKNTNENILNKLKSTPLWELLNLSGELENNIMVLIFSIMDEFPDAVPVMLMKLPAKALVSRFKICWAGAVFRPDLHIKRYLRGEFDPKPQEKNAKNKSKRIPSKFSFGSKDERTSSEEQVIFSSMITNYVF